MAAFLRVVTTVDNLALLKHMSQISDLSSFMIPVANPALDSTGRTSVKECFCSLLAYAAAEYDGQGFQTRNDRSVSEKAIVTSSRRKVVVVKTRRIASIRFDLQSQLLQVPWVEVRAQTPPSHPPQQGRKKLERVFRSQMWSMGPEGEALDEGNRVAFEGIPARVYVVPFEGINPFEVVSRENMGK